MITWSRVKKPTVITGISLLLSPVLIFGLSNLSLRSSKARSIISGQIEARTGLQASIHSASWSPWSGISCYGISVQQPEILRDQIPEPLLTVRRIRVVPEWFPLIDKQLIIKEVFVDGAQLTFPAEILSKLGHSATEEAPAAMAMTAPDQGPNALNANLPKIQNSQAHATKPPEIDPHTPAGVTHTQPAETARAQLDGVPPFLAAETTPEPARDDNPTSPEKVARPATAITRNHQPVTNPKKTSEPTVWVHCSDSSVEIISRFTKQSLYKIQRIDGKVPISGHSAVSTIELKKISSFGKTLSESLVIPLALENQTLSTKQFQTEFSGVTCMMKAAMGLTHGHPFSFEVLVPNQKDISIELQKSLSFQFGNIAARAAFQGYLIAPATWHGQWISHAEHIDAHFGQQADVFEYGNAVFTYQGGVLRCLDARLVGEGMSILANAGALQDGRFSAIIRFVSTLERLNHVASFTHPEGSNANFTPLHTPQRSALDVQIYGNLDGIKYQPDPFSQSFQFDPQLFNLD